MSRWVRVWINDIDSKSEKEQCFSEFSVWLIEERNNSNKGDLIDLVFLELRCFSSILPSMLKGEIVRMNVDAMGEHYKILLWCIYKKKFIDDNIVMSFQKTKRVADYDFCIKDNISHIYLCIVSSASYSMSLLQWLVCRT